MNSPSAPPPQLYLDILASPLPEAECMTLIKQAMQACFAEISPVRGMGKPLAFSIRLDENDEVQKLNDTFRHKNYATNVLTFPTDDMDAWDVEDNVFYLGDIVVASGVLQAEAQAATIPVAHHLQHLIVHGLLHLFEYDHIVDEEAEVMEALEARILARLNIKNPYAG